MRRSRVGAWVLSVVPLFAAACGGGSSGGPPVAEVEFTASLPVPASLAPGSYRLALWLPDPAPLLRARPEYSVRFANEGV